MSLPETIDSCVWLRTSRRGCLNCCLPHRAAGWISNGSRQNGAFRKQSSTNGLEAAAMWVNKRRRYVEKWHLMTERTPFCHPCHHTSRCRTFATSFFDTPHILTTSTPITSLTRGRNGSCEVTRHYHFIHKNNGIGQAGNLCQYGRTLFFAKLHNVPRPCSTHP